MNARLKSNFGFKLRPDVIQHIYSCCFYFLFFTLCATYNSFAQDASTTPVKNSGSPGSQSFLLTGAGAVTFSADKNGNTFAPMTFMMMPLIKFNDKLFLEAGAIMHPTEGSGFGLEVLNLHYQIAPNLSFYIGKFAAPWGNVLDMFGEGFVARFPVGPVGFADDGMAPTDQVGLGFQGGLQVGDAKMLYDVYLSNGPQLITGDPDMYGHTSYESLVDNNKNKSIGGKIGFLPFSNSSLQIDVFGQTAAKTGATGDTTYENVGSTSFGVDMNFVKLAGPVLIRARGQYEQTNTDKALYGAETTAFNNSGNSWYVSGTLRPSGSSNKFVRNLELAGRYVTYTPPKDASWGGSPVTQFTLSLNYFFTWSSQINFGYDIVDDGTTKVNQFAVRTLYKF